MGNCCAAKCRIRKYDPAGWGGHFGAYARESSNRSFDFLARKNFQLIEPIGTSANRLMAKATVGAISHIQIDVNRF
jgi:hypothetical protein